MIQLCESIVWKLIQLCDLIVRKRFVLVIQSFANDSVVRFGPHERFGFLIQLFVNVSIVWIRHLQMIPWYDSVAWFSRSWTICSYDWVVHERLSRVIQPFMNNLVVHKWFSCLSQSFANDLVVSFSRSRMVRSFTNGEIVCKWFGCMI